MTLSIGISISTTEWKKKKHNKILNFSKFFAIFGKDTRNLCKQMLLFLIGIKEHSNLMLFRHVQWAALEQQVCNKQWNGCYISILFI